MENTNDLTEINLTSVISESNVDNFFESINDKDNNIQSVINNYNIIKSQTKNELIKIFNVQELKILKEACNMIILTPNYSAVLTVFDYFGSYYNRYNKNLNKQQAETIQEKILQLKDSQAVILVDVLSNDEFKLI